MSNWKKFKLESPRDERCLHCVCYADERMFLKNFSDMPKDMQKIFKDISIPCEGSGLLGEWCGICPFGEID